MRSRLVVEPFLAWLFYFGFPVFGFLMEYGDANSIPPFCVDSITLATGDALTCEGEPDCCTPYERRLLAANTAGTV